MVAAAETAGRAAEQWAAVAALEASVAVVAEAALTAAKGTGIAEVAMATEGSSVAVQ